MAREVGVNAIADGDLALVELLLEYGANINQLSFCGQTPLYIAAARGDVNIVDVLMRRGADKTIPMTCNGAFPLHIAAQNFLSE